MSSLRRLLYPTAHRPSHRLDLSFLLLRAVTGSALILHGWAKIQHPFSWQGARSHTPAVFQLLAAISEFFGGIALIVGLLTPIASFGILCTMAVAVWTHAVTRGQPFVGRGGSYELPLSYLVTSVLFLLNGAGRLSLDALLFGRRGR